MGGKPYTEEEKRAALDAAAALPHGKLKAWLDKQSFDASTFYAWRRRRLRATATLKPLQTKKPKVPKPTPAPTAEKPQEEPEVQKDVEQLDLAQESSAVNHPSHYGGAGQFECIAYIEAHDLGFALGNAVKYITRAGKKPGASELQDLQKARWYLDRRIAVVERINV